MTRREAAFLVLPGLAFGGMNVFATAPGRPTTLGPEARRKLAEAAKAALRTAPSSVTQKSRPPASGNLRDYASMGPYWWPDPKKADGLPYIRRDGEVNPESRGDRSDLDRMLEMARAVEVLSLAWQESRREEYARKAAGLLRHWFLDTSSGMNPHLQYAQEIPGICTGRAVGIIDGIVLVPIPAVVARLRGAPGWSADDEAGMKSWSAAYLRWLVEGDRGREIDKAANNHGTWYDVQVVTHARFTGREELVRRVLQGVGRRRLEPQIEADGRQPHEIARTQSWGYSLMNLRGLMRLAKYAEKSGPDLWNHRGKDGRGILPALLYLVRNSTAGRKWPHPSMTAPKVEDLWPLVAEAARVYPAGSLPGDLVREAKESRAREWQEF